MRSTYITEVEIYYLTTSKSLVDQYVWENDEINKMIVQQASESEFDES